ncbi:head-tail connector protein, partial [Limimaricola cinnabarinus]|uniref:head-tail connector protein n=1 Tax=Limimaricola cinnabarinus TaxID=1125964 RepID=UPI0005ECF452
MRLIETGVVPETSLPVEGLRAHLRLGTGFAETGLQDTGLAGFLRAAIAAIEARTGKVLLARGFALELTRWRDACRQPLPVALCAPSRARHGGRAGRGAPQARGGWR